MNRADALVRAAKARAALTAFLIKAPEVETPDRLLHVVEGLEYTEAELSSLLTRMASQGLIQRLEVVHPRYRFGYYTQGAAAVPEEPVRRKRKSPSLEQELDVTANLDGSLRIKFRGLVLRLSVEGE